MRNNNYESIRQTFDEIIKKSVKMEMSDGNFQLNDDDLKTSDFPPPPSDMYDRIIKECTNSTTDSNDEYEEKSHNRKKYKFHRPIVIAAAILILSFGALSVSAVCLCV